ncbi:MAG: helix-turn-helix transcriptional regulator [Planctomycetes bacterium]|nr:helix-turn-helix transcriptional regulator [Planctomycetota bacterium]
MSIKGTNREDIERQLYECLRDEGGIIPQSVEEVERAEARLAAFAVELPEKLRDSRQALDRLQAAEMGATESAAPRVFGQFTAMLRVKKGWSVESLAAKAKVDEEEIRNIEADLGYEPKPRTVKQLADVFGIVPKSLACLAGLTRKTDERIVEGAVMFAACGKDMHALTREQRRAIKQFVALLNSLD